MATVRGGQTGDGTSGVAPGSGDSFRWRYPLSVVACVMAVDTSGYLARIDSVWGFVGMLLFLMGALYALVLVLLGIIALLRARVKQALAFVLGPVVIVLLIVSNLQWIIFALPLDLLRFYYHRGEYQAVIDKMSPAERASKAVFFDWGRTILDAMSPPTYYWLVYDESGQIAWSDVERTQEWKDRASTEFLDIDQCRTLAYRLSGHYYSVSGSCY
jgi:hypothetical protein